MEILVFASFLYLFALAIGPVLIICAVVLIASLILLVALGPAIGVIGVIVHISEGNYGAAFFSFLWAVGTSVGWCVAWKRRLLNKTGT